MGPIRGLKRNRKSEPKKLDKNVFAASLSSQNESMVDWWDGFSKRIKGPLSPSESKDAINFESIFKMSRRTFSYICSHVKEHMETRNFSSLKGNYLSLEEKVAVALRRLGSGESITTIGAAFRLSQTTVSQITWQFVDAMEEKGLKHIRWPTEQHEMEEIKSKFERICGLPNCCGAIDTTHVTMTLPANGSSNDVWLDNEKNCSMSLQAIVDPDMRFCNIITGWPGSLSDDTVLKSSGFFKLCEEGTCLNGKKTVLSEGTEVREYIVGDSGFPLLEWLLTPYQGENLSDEKSEFNKRLSSMQMMAGTALMRLKDMWKIIEGALWMPDKNKLPRIILVCCILHNIVIDMGDQVHHTSSHVHDSGYQQRSCESVDNSGSLLRDKLSLFLSGK